jgi:hypothetical protein
MPSPIIVERAFAFAVRIIKLCERLWDGSRATRKIADQLFVVTQRDVAWELDEAIQLKKMITRAIHTAQSPSWRGAH